MRVLKRADIVQDVLNAYQSGHLFFSTHAQVQMKARKVRVSDVGEMLCRAYHEEGKDQLRDDRRDWKYALRGLNDNGNKDIRIIVVFRSPSIVVVTVIDKNR